MDGSCDVVLRVTPCQHCAKHLVDSNQFRRIQDHLFYHQEAETLGLVLLSS